MYVLLITRENGKFSPHPYLGLRLELNDLLYVQISLIVWFPTAANINKVAVNTDGWIRSKGYQSIAKWVWSAPQT